MVFFRHRWKTLSWMLVVVSVVAPAGAMADDAPAGITFLQFGDPVFRAGLAQHDMLDDAGYRLLHTGFRTQTFGDAWTASPLLESARSSGRPYYIDRITGGMPFQSLEGIGAIAATLKDDPNFLGFQAHEWGNSPTHDYHRIQQLILEKGKPFNAASFAAFEGRTATPYFSGGDFGIYNDLYRPLESQSDVEAYLESYFKKLIALTDGQLISVTGHGQLYHTALRLGARNVMAEIGNQVPLTAFQIACVRGAARQHGKPFGTYYETWGGTPMGCVCATSFSPWWPLEPEIKERMDGYNIGPQYGSGRSLQRRLMYYAWLSGSAWWSEEWGAENYFSDWESYPLTAYGTVTRDFQAVTRGLPAPRPVVPVAVVMPPDTFGIDIRYMAGYANTLWRIAPGDAFHDLLRRFGKAFFAPQAAGGGSDAQNLTPSPWIGCFDVFDAKVAESVLGEYACAVYFDAEQAAASGHPNPVVFDAMPESESRIREAIVHALPYRVTGTVGVAQARCSDRYVLGVFNNLGMTKTAQGEQADPEATQLATVSGVTAGMHVLLGEAFLQDTSPDSVSLRIPAGELVLLSFSGK